MKYASREENISLLFYLVKEPELKPFGHNFKDEYKKNLKETGNMGRIVKLKNRQGKYAPSFIRNHTGRAFFAIIQVIHVLQQVIEQVLPYLNLLMLEWK